MGNLFSAIPTFNIGISRLILLVSLCATLLYNLTFFRNTAAVFPLADGGLYFMGSLAVFLFAITVLVFSVLCFRFLTKPVLIAVILGAAFANHFMSRFNVVIDTDMINNIMRTDSGEIADLMDPGLLIELALLGLLPALVIARTRIRCASAGKEAVARLKLIGFACLLLVASIAPFTSYYTSFFREHKILRYYANPATFIYSTGKYLDMALAQADTGPRQVLGADAHIPAMDIRRELIILVVGEAARADHFSLNGYARNTNPLLAREDVISFRNVISCGTSTAYSLPCMFSGRAREDFDLETAGNSENLLDVLQHAGVKVLWRDNNSDSKGLTEATAFESFKTPETNRACDAECRDVGMLEGLESYIAAQPEGDITIVLHQMGNHGPAYRKRYPDEFETFTPACQSGQLEQCTDEEIGNAYDNAILYTDYFLAQVIAFLKNYDDRFETAMYYMSDHGESLGENRLYLHGLPWRLAPMAQKHVASILWFGASYEADREAVAARASADLSHDNYFHTVLGLMEIQAQGYDESLNLLAR